MLDPPRTLQPPGTVAGQLIRTAEVPGLRSAAAVRLLAGTLVVVGAWLSAAFGNLHTSLAKEAQPPTAAKPIRAAVASASYWQRGMDSAFSDQALVGSLDWSSNDPAWSTVSPADNVRRAEQAMNRPLAEPSPTPAPDNPDKSAPDNGNPPDAPAAVGDAAAAVPARLPPPEGQTAVLTAASTPMLDRPIQFELMTTVDPEAFTAPAEPRALDVALPLATAPAPQAADSPTAPSEFQLSRFGLAEPMVRLAQASPTEALPGPDNGPDAAASPSGDSSSAAEAGAGGAEEGKDLATAKKLGDEPVSHELEFLRSETVLLKPCEWQIDVGLSYLLFEDDVPVALLGPGGEVASVVQGKVKERRLFVPLALRYGWSKNTQLFCNIPLGWANTELSLTGSDDYDNFGGVGDITGGATYLLRHCDNEDIVLTVAATLPTGGDPYNRNLVFQGAALGEGFWALSADALRIKSIDPVSFFYGVGTRQYFSHEYLGSQIKLGGEYRYQFGLGLAVNPRVTLSTRFAGAYISELRVNEARVPGTLQEPMSIRLAATISQQCRFVEPFVEFGITDDAPASYFGVVWTY